MKKGLKRGDEAELKRGDRVKDIYGKIGTVCSADDVMVRTYENFNNWSHPSKVWKLKEYTDEERAANVAELDK